MGPSDHRNRPVGNQETTHGGHRSTPRLVAMIAHEMGRNPVPWTREGMAHGKMFGFGAIPEEAREQTARNMIAAHRSHVDKGLNGSPYSNMLGYIIKNRDLIKNEVDDKWEADNEHLMNGQMPSRPTYP